jgi:protein TonB
MNATALSSPTSSPATHSSLPLSRNTVIALAVVALHVGFIWALQSGLLMRAAEIVVPAEILTQFVDPPAPKVEPVPPAPPAPPVPMKKAVAKAPAPTLPTPQLVAIADPNPAPNAPTAMALPQAPAAPAATAVAPVAPMAATPASPAPPRIEAPVIDADYRANEGVFRKPDTSVRLGESGKVLLNVTVGTNGFASNVTLIKSSGYPRLDNAAIQGARKLKFRPAMQAGVPIEKGYELPVNYLAETN